MLENKTEIERAHRDVSMGDYAGRFFVMQSSYGADPYEVIHHVSRSSRTGLITKVSDTASSPDKVRAAIMNSLGLRSWRHIVIFDRGRNVSYYIESSSTIGDILELHRVLQLAPNPGIDYGFKLAATA